jgi:hypothetical protein
MATATENPNGMAQRLFGAGARMCTKIGNGAASALAP